MRSESAGSMLHLSIGEEGIAGIVRAMDTQDTFTIDAAYLRTSGVSYE